ncbi:probable deoR-family transcriptional regulator, partial [Sulfitobacter indolifex HEL-45]
MKSSCRSSAAFQSFGTAASLSSVSGSGCPRPASIGITLLRDIAALRDEGFVIHSESGRGGGVQLDPQSMQTTARLSVAEVFALLISVAAVRAAQNLPFSDLADAGLAKIERALPSDKVRDLR